MNELNENKQKQKIPIIKQARQSGGSVIITLTDIAPLNTVYEVIKNNEIITLIPIKLESQK